MWKDKEEPADEPMGSRLCGMFVFFLFFNQHFASAHGVMLAASTNQTT